MTIEVNGTTLHYVQEGSGPDLVLVPGLGGSVHLWYAQLKRFSALYRVTAIDPRGHGLSAKPPGPYTIRGVADDVGELTRALALEPAVVVGSSMAGMVVVELAAAHPDRVSGLVLVGGFPVLGAAGKERMAERARLVEESGMAAVVDSVVGTALSTVTHQAQPALVGLLRGLLLANVPAAYAASIRALLAADVNPLLAQVRCPALVVLGDGVQVAPLPASQALCRGIRGAALRVIPDAGHLPFLEQPAAFNAALLEWIAGL